MITPFASHSSHPALSTRAQRLATVYCTDTLLDGRLALYGWRRNATLIDAPAATADILKAQGAAAFPEAGATASALAVAESLPPLHDAVVRVASREKTVPRVACSSPLTPALRRSRNGVQVTCF
jgi:hypothetical protein